MIDPFLCTIKGYICAVAFNINVIKLTFFNNNLFIPSLGKSHITQVYM